MNSALTLSQSPFFSYSFFSDAVPEVPLEELVVLASQGGFDGLDLGSVDGRRDLPTYFEERLRKKADWLSVLSRAGVRLRMLRSSASLVGCSAKAREELLQYARWAERLEVPWVVIDGGEMGRWGGDAWALETACEFLDWWNEERVWHRWRVQLLVKTNGFFNRIERVGALEAKGVGEFGVLWCPDDCNDNVEAVWDTIGHLIRHVSFGRASSRSFMREDCGLRDCGGHGRSNGSRAVPWPYAFSGGASLQWRPEWGLKCMQLEH